MFGWETLELSLYLDTSTKLQNNHCSSNLWVGNKHRNLFIILICVNLFSRVSFLRGTRMQKKTDMSEVERKPLIVVRKGGV